MPLPADIKAVAVPPKNTVEMLMGNYSSGAPINSFACADSSFCLPGAPDFFLLSLFVFYHNSAAAKSSGVRPHGHRGDTGGILALFVS